MGKELILIVEDDQDLRRSVTEAVTEAGYEVLVASDAGEGLALFEEHNPAVVLTDLVLPDFDGIELLSRLQRLDGRTPVMLMTAYGTIESSVKAMHAGAYDYLSKPLDIEELQSKLRRAVETSRLRHQVENLARAAGGFFGSSAMVAEAPPMKRLLEQVAAVADTQATVLIQGESGTGKELIARALHTDGGRATGPWVAVNCGAFAESLLESELFGHEKGAFTGATSRYKGAFERAHGGTLFLDEIGDAPMAVQIKLLRTLEEREIRRLGGQEVLRVDVRFVCATNRDLNELVEDGSFREDLLYRVNVVCLRVPPLRERREDIRPLVDRMTAEFCERHGRRITTISESFYRKMESYDWPGNVRQLRNVLESAVLLSPRPELDEEIFREGGVPLFGSPFAAPAAGSRSADWTVPEGLTLGEMEREILLQVLTRFEGNRTLTAEALGLSRRTIQRKIQEHELPF